MRYQIREKFFHIGEDSNIINEDGQPVFKVDGKVFSIHNELSIQDMSGQEVVKIHRRLLSLVPKYEISRPGVADTEVSKHLFSPFIDRYTVDVPGPDDIEAAGSLLEHEYTFKRNGEVIATVSKQWLSMTATYGVDIAPNQDDVLILATVLALDLAEDRER